MIICFLWQFYITLVIVDYLRDFLLFGHCFILLVICCEFWLRSNLIIWLILIFHLLISFIYFCLLYSLHIVTYFWTELFNLNDFRFNYRKHFTFVIKSNFKVRKRNISILSSQTLLLFLTLLLQQIHLLFSFYFFHFFILFL